MPTIGHIAVGMAAGRLHEHDGPRTRQAMFWGAVLAVAPDLDLLAGPLGVPYESAFAHRGALHSLTAALLIGALAGWVARQRGAPFLRSAGLASLLVASHAALDILNTGTKVAILWPFSPSYYSVGWQPIPAVSQLSDFFTAAGPRVVLHETLYFLPVWAYALWPFFRKSRAA